MGARRFLNLEGRQLIGLDIDSASIRAVQLRRKNGQYTVTGAAVTDIPPGENDPEERRANTTQAVRQCLDETAPGSRLVVCGLRGPEVVIRGFEFPVLPSDEIDGAVALESSQICPFSPEESVLDHQITCDRGKKTQGFWVAATRNLIEAKREVVRDAGRKCTLIDVDGLALLNTLLVLSSSPSQARETDENGGDDVIRTAVLSVGDSYTSIALADHARRPFVRDLLSGEQEILRQMVVEMKLPPETVRAALYDGASVDPQTLRQGLDKACTPLFDDVARTLRYYLAEDRHIEISKVMVCGNLASVKSFVELLDEKLPFDVEPWNPLRQLRCEAGPECESALEKVGPAVAVAAGLAMRTI